MGMLFYGSLEYFIENGEEDTGFYSIPQGMWYAVQTLTSLGYGDFRRDIQTQSFFNEFFLFMESTQQKV